MRTSDLLSLVAGLGSIALGALVPSTAPYAMPAGFGAVMAALPRVSHFVDRIRRRKV